MIASSLMHVASSSNNDEMQRDEAADHLASKTETKKDKEREIRA